MKLKFFGTVSIFAAALTILLFNQREFPQHPEAASQKENPPHYKPHPLPDPAGLASSNTVPVVALGLVRTNAPSPTSTKLWASPGEAEGKKLDPKSVRYLKAKATGIKLPGRSATIDPESLDTLPELKRGDNVVIPLLGGEQVTGLVNLVQVEAGGQVLIGGELTGLRLGTFSLGAGGTRIGGVIQLPKEELAYEITEQADGRLIMQEKHLSEIICLPMPRFTNEPQASVQRLRVQTVSPILSSRPNATAVFYLDFDGETVTDSRWNGGRTIVAPAFSLSRAQIMEIWNRVKEDFWPFNIDITTDLARYNSAPIGKRMRCIITPNDAASPGHGGVATRGSFRYAGSFGLSATIPCWSFNAGIRGISETISHELGHTLGLHHDGRKSPVEVYYSGHGSGSVSWGPIMGGSFTPNLTQWSKGQYANADNTEDDISIISGSANGFGFVADEAGGNRSTAVALNAPGGAVNQAGIISAGNQDADYFRFTAGSAGTVNIQASPAAIGPNLFLYLQLQDSSGTEVVHVYANQNDSRLRASLTANISAGDYYVVVQASGLNPIAGPGFPRYGSMGAYQLSGNVPSPNSVTVPVISSVSPATFAASTDARQLIISGSNFKPSSDQNASRLVYFLPDNRQANPRLPIYTSSSELRDTVIFSAPGTWKVKVVNGNTESSPFSFIVSVPPQC